MPKRLAGTETVGKILDAAGELLAEVGLERLSTNLICERAGITPPALYRYFPNKHAVLKELGERLLSAQDQAFTRWLYVDYDESDLDASFLKLLQAIASANQSQPHVDWVFRALHASPVLIEVRLGSNNRMAQICTDWALARWPHAERATTRRHFRLAIQLGDAALQMLTEEEMEPDLYLPEAARILALQHRLFFGIAG